MLAVTQYSGADIAHAQSVHQQAAGRHRVTQAGRILTDLDRTADFGNHDVARVDAHLTRELRVPHQHTVFAVYRDKVLRSAQTQHELEILLAGVAGNMDSRRAVINDLCAQFVQLVDHVVDRLLIARDGGRCDKDAVAGVDFHLFVAAIRHAVQGGHGLAL